VVGNCSVSVRSCARARAQARALLPRGGEVRCGCGWMDGWMLLGWEENGRHVEMARCEERDGTERMIRGQQAT
jgi:hypothetical protein